MALNSKVCRRFEAASNMISKSGANESSSNLSASSSTCKGKQRVVIKEVRGGFFYTFDIITKNFKRFKSTAPLLVLI